MRTTSFTLLLAGLALTVACSDDDQNLGAIAGSSGQSGSSAQGPGGAGGQAGTANPAGGAGTSSGGGSAGAAGGLAGNESVCVTDPACITQTGGPSCRRGGSCVAMTSKDCTRVLGNASQGGQIVLGVMAPLTGSQQAVGTSHVKAIQTALEGYRDVSDDTVLVVCDEVADPTAAATHLTDDLGVPLVYGPFWGDAISKTRTVFKGRPTINLLPVADDPSLPYLSDDDQVWSCKPGRAPINVYWRNVIGKIEPYFASKSSPVRLTMLVAGDASSQNLAAGVINETFFNQQSGDANLKEGNLVRFDYEDPHKVTPSYAAVTTKVTSGASLPDLIVILPGGGEVPSLIGAIESAWPTGSTYPRYLVVGSEFLEQTAGLSAAPGAPPLASRLLALDHVGADASLRASFVKEFQALQMGVSPRPGDEYAYDCFWLGQYALLTATSLGSKPWSELTGTTFASAGIGRINPPGQVVGVGGADAKTARGLLEASSDLDLQGVSSALDVDLGWHAPAPHGRLSCIKDGKLVASGVEFDPSSGGVSGTNGCP